MTRRLVKIRTFDEAGRSRLGWAEVGDIAEEASQGPPGPKGDPGEPGRTIAIFEQPNEPMSAQAGDYWITGE